MRVPQEKREPYAVHFVSANKHATVISQVCRTTYTILYKISQMRIFLTFANFRKYAKFLASSIYINSYIFFYVFTLLHLLPESDRG